MSPLPDLSQWDQFLVCLLVLFLIVSARFFLVAGLFHFVFYGWQKEKWAPLKINKVVDKKQFRREMGYSFASSLIFAVIITGTLLLWQRGYTKVYLDPQAYGWAWLPASLVLSFLIHEIYYYWVHRWMHRPQVFRKVHRVHHSSRIPTPWTAFSFHPLESLLLALIFPAIIMVMPMHPVVIILQLVLMTVSSVINHLDIEIYPKWFSRSIAGKWLIGSTHHSRHHTHVNYNYGLHFTFLDELHGTEWRQPAADSPQPTVYSQQPTVNSPQSPVDSYNGQ